jgi:DNA-binding protein Fis
VGLATASKLSRSPQIQSGVSGTRAANDNMSTPHSSLRTLPRGNGSTRYERPVPQQPPPVDAEPPTSGLAKSQVAALKVLTETLLRRIQSIQAQAESGNGGLDLQKEVHCFEAELIRSALIETGGRQRRAAKLLGMKVTTLNNKIKRYNLASVSEDPRY